MKRNRLLALFTALVLVISTMLSSVSFAAENTDIAGTEFEGVVGKLSAVGVMQGYPDGTFRPDGEITRAEFAAIAVRALGLGDAAKVSVANTKFSDVPYSHWAAGYINLATDRGIIKGYTDGTFKPEGKITNAEAITILVRLIGMGPVVDKQGTWPANYIAAANVNGILDGVNVASTVNATRGSAAKMLVNTLEAELWGPEGYNDDGSVSYGKLEGETLLSENLEVKSLEDVMLYSVDDEEIELDDETYDYAGKEIEEAELFLNLVDAWVKDGDVIYVVSTSDVVLDAIEFDLDDEEVKAVDADKDYDLNLDDDDDLDVVVYVNGEKEDIEDLDGKKYDYAKLVLNDKNDVIAIDAYNWDDHIIVKDVDDYDVVGYGDEELDVEDYTIVKDGVVITADDLEEGDILFYNDDAEFAEVYNNSVSGEIEKVYTDRIEVDDEDYEYATMKYLNEDEDLVDFNKEAAEQYEDEGDDVEIFLTRTGDPIFITGNLGVEKTSTVYVYVTEAQASSYNIGRTYYRNLTGINEMGKEVDYDIDVDDIAEFTDGTWSVGDVVAIEVDEDGDIEDVDVLGEGEGQDNKDDIEENDEVESDDKYAKGYRLLSSALVFDVEDYTDDTDDIVISTLKDADFTKIIDADIYLNDDDEIIVLVVNDSDRDTDTTTYAAVATADAVELSDGKTWRLKLVVDGEESKYYTKDGEDIANAENIKAGDLLEVKINDETKEVDEVATHAYTQKGFIVDDISVSNQTVSSGSQVRYLDDAVILDATDDYTEIQVRDLKVGDKLDFILVDEDSKYVTYAVRTEISDDDDEKEETEEGVITYKNSDTTKIEVDGTVYVLDENTVLRNEVGVIEFDGVSEINGNLSVGDKVFDIVADDNVISSFKYVADDADRDAAKTVIELINNLPSITDANFETKVTEARTEYTNLTTVQQNLVTNLDDLEEAEATLAHAEAVEEVATAKSALDAAAIKGTNVDLDNVTANLTLPISDTNVEISWESSNTDIIATDGTVTRPSYTDGDAIVKLTATIKHTAVETVKDTKEFTVTVKAAAITPNEEIALDKEALEIEFADGDSATNVTSNLTLPLSGDNGTTIGWESSNIAIIATDGTVTRPSGVDIQVTLTATISKTGGTDVTKVFVVIVKAEE